MDAFSHYLSSAFSWRTENPPASNPSTTTLTTALTMPETIPPNDLLEKIRAQCDLFEHAEECEEIKQLCIHYLVDNAESRRQDKLFHLALDYTRHHHLKAAQIIWSACLPENKFFSEINHFDPQLFINELHEVGKNGHDVAPYHLGMLFLEGKCVEQNRATALIYLQVAASRSYQPAIHAIHTYFPKSLFDQAKKAEQRGQFKKALYLYEKAVEEGDKNAMYRLGEWHLAKSDPLMAAVYFKKAYRNGHEDAQLQLGNTYYSWHKNSIFMNSALLEQAKKYYLRGKSGKNAEMSNFRYLTLLADEENDIKAHFLLGKLYLKIPSWIPHEEALNKANKHLTSAANAGHANAAYFLFIQYEMGLFSASTPEHGSKTLAMRYYNLAAKNGHTIARLEKEVESKPDPAKAMALFYQHSKGDMTKSYPPNREKAQKYLIIAAESGSKKALKSVIKLSRTDSIKTPSTLAEYQKKLALIERLSAQVEAEKNRLQDASWELATDTHLESGIKLKPWPDFDYL